MVAPLIVHKLLVRMERRGVPFRLLLEACSFIFDSALEMADGLEAPDSPSRPFQGGGGAAGIEESKSGGGRGSDDAGAAGSQAGADNL